MEEPKMQLVDWLDDLCVRFIINLPQEELESVERICFQVEEAQWFYEDFIRPLDPALPSLPLRTFCLRMFKHCPLLASFDEDQHIRAYEEFLAYKTRVPVRGAILLNDAMDEVVLVRGWKKGANWSFPRGKINKDEKDLDCAVREAYEETGYDVREAGLIHDENNVKFIEVTMREQHMKLFVFRGVPMETAFAPRTRKEISKIQWYKLSTLPGWRKGKHQQSNASESALSANKLYMVAPFLHPLKSWIAQQRKLDAGQSHASVYAAHLNQPDGYLTDERELQPYFPSEQDTMNFSQPIGHIASLNANYQQIDGTVQAPVIHSDPANELKRLLSVGQDPQNINPAQVQTALDTRGTNLLALLRGTSNQHEINPNDPNMYQTQPGYGNQTQMSRQVAPVSYVQNDRPDVTWTLQPESDQSQRYQQPPQRPSGHDPFLPRHASSPQEQNAVPIIRKRGQISRIDGSREASLFSALHETEDRRQIAGPYSQLQGSHPQTSGASAQNLSDHAMNLLSALKTPPSRGLMSASQPAKVNATIDTRNDQATELQSGRLDIDASESRSRQALAPAGSNLNGSSQTQVPNAAASSTVPRTEQSAHRNTLLDLFRKSPTTSRPWATAEAGTQNKVADLLGQPWPAQVKTPPKPESLEVTRPKTPVKSPNLVPEPVELSAVPSPGPAKKQLFDPKDGKMKAHVPSLRIMSRPPTSPRTEQDTETGVTSATVTGPVKVPDFDTVKRRPHSRHANGNQQKQKQDANPRSAQQAPVQILKRPETPKATSPAPASSPQSRSKAKFGPALNPVETRQPQTTAPRALVPSVKSENPLISTFNPQILRRPQADSPLQLQEPDKPAIRVAEEPPLEKPVAQPATSQKQALLSLFGGQAVSTGPNVPAEAPKESRDAAADHKQSLLSLFGKPANTTAATSSRASSGVNHDRATSGNESKSDAPSGVSEIAQRASHSTSRPKLASIGSPDYVISPLASPLANESRGSQTPISSSDKGFLLNFLDGFAKGSGQSQRK